MIQKDVAMIRKRVALIPDLADTPEDLVQAIGDPLNALWHDAPPIRDHLAQLSGRASWSQSASPRLRTTLPRSRTDPQGDESESQSS